MIGRTVVWHGHCVFYERGAVVSDRRSVLGETLPNHDQGEIPRPGQRAPAVKRTAGVPQLYFSDCENYEEPAKNRFRFFF